MTTDGANETETHHGIVIFGDYFHVKRDNYILAVDYFLKLLQGSIAIL